MNIQNVHFILQFIAMILDWVNLLLWSMSNYHDSGMGGRHIMHVLFSMAVPGYVVILTVLVVAYLLDEQPGKMIHRLFLIVGLVLFLIVGIIGMINCLDVDRGAYPLLIAIFNIVIGILLGVDLLKNEGLF